MACAPIGSPCLPSPSSATCCPKVYIEYDILSTHVACRGTKSCRMGVGGIVVRGGERFKSGAGGDQGGLEVLRLDLPADAEPSEPGGAVRLVVAHRHDELRDAGRQALAAGADAAVMDDRGGVREDLAEGNEGETD